MKYSVNFRFNTYGFIVNLCNGNEIKPLDEIQDGRQYIKSRQSRVYQFNYYFYLVLSSFA